MSPSTSSDSAKVNPFVSQAALSSQQESRDGQQQSDAKSTAAAVDTPANPPPPSDSAANPPASLEAPQDYDSHSAQPLDAQASLAGEAELHAAQPGSSDEWQRAATAMASLWSSIATADTSALVSTAYDALHESLPIDAAALDEALGDLLDELEGLGNELANSLAQAGVSPWAIAAALGVAAGAAHRRRRLLRGKVLIGARGAVLMQFPELLGLVPRGDA
jgi:hypothetical protein